MLLNLPITTHFLPLSHKRNATRRAVTGVGCIFKRRFAFREESQTPHQTNDNPTKTDSRSCGPFVLSIIRYFLDKIFEPNGQLKSNPRVRLPSGPKSRFDSMTVRVKTIRLLVASRILQDTGRSTPTYRMR